MAHTTTSGVTSDPSSSDATLIKVTDYHEPARGTPQVRLDALLRASERLVKSIAPPPVNTTTGELEVYRVAAADTELEVFVYLFTTGGYKKSINEGIGSLREGETYVDGGAEIIVKRAMGSYIKKTTGVARISSFPLARG